MCKHSYASSAHFAFEICLHDTFKDSRYSATNCEKKPIKTEKKFPKQPKKQKELQKGNACTRAYMHVENTSCIQSGLPCVCCTPWKTVLVVSPNCVPIIWYCCSLWYCCSKLGDWRWIWVCMYVCIYVCMYVCTFALFDDTVAASWATDGGSEYVCM